MANLNSIFQFFVPKDKNFFPLFEKATSNLVSMSRLLVEVIQTSDKTKRNELIKQISNLEHTGDEITHEIFVELSRNFITPFDREDIHSLISAIDDVADFIHGSTNRMMMYKVEEFSQHMSKLAELTLASSIELEKAVKELRNMRNTKQISDACIKINSNENHADTVFDMAVGELFENETNAIELIKIKEILSALETATDKCEDAANVLESILIKNA